MLKNFKAMVELATGAPSGSTHMQWVYQDAKNAYEARLAIETKYGRILQGPIEEVSKQTGSFYDNW